VHKHEKFRRKPLKGNGRGRIRERNERDPPRDILSRSPEFLLVTPLIDGFYHADIFDDVVT